MLEACPAAGESIRFPTNASKMSLFSFICVLTLDALGKTRPVFQPGTEAGFSCTRPTPPGKKNCIKTMHARLRTVFNVKKRRPLKDMKNGPLFEGFVAESAVSGSI